MPEKKSDQTPQSTADPPDRSSDELHPDQWITTQQLADRTNSAVITWARRRIEDEREGPPFVRIGRSIRYRWGDVQDWLKKRTQA